ncbi:hypothetical protein QTP88_027275 [Uroleucon formosanum]
MSDGRKRLSGAAYKKASKLKLEKEKKIISQTAKLTTFFGNSLPSTSDLQSETFKTELFSSEPSNKNEQDPLEISVVKNNLVNNAEKQLHTSSSIPSKDPALWELNETTRDYVAINGACQNLDDLTFLRSKRNYSDQSRRLSINLFQRKLLNGEKSMRNYLIYSESTGSVYCGPCRLFSYKSTGALITEGFSDWKHPEYVGVHENSKSHISSVLAIKERGCNLGRIDKKLTDMVETEVKYWRNVLIRVVATVKTLSSRGLPFRGSSDKFGSPHNGNYMMALELIAEFDPFLSSHIEKFGNVRKGYTSYLLFQTCQEFITMMAHKVQNQIIDEVKKAKYYAIIIDSTPDISHIDQLSIILRYTLDSGKPVERFIEFIPNTGHKAQDMIDALIKTFDKHDIDINNCRGQSYDNASNMSGVYNGLQAKIKQLNSLAYYVPCSAHSLNLVGECAAVCCKEGSNFFLFLQKLYTFFSASTYRWKLLQDVFSQSDNVSVKRLSDTRWSARAEACSSLNTNWNEIILALSNILKNDIEKEVTKSEARGLLNQMDRIETAFMVVFWNKVLERFNATNKKLQTVEIDIESVVCLYNSLHQYVKEMRNMFDIYEKLAIEKTGLTYLTNIRRKKRKLQYDESPGEEVHFDSRESLKVNSYFVILDKLDAELEKRKKSYENIKEKFSFLLKFTTLSSSELDLSANELCKIYNNDLGESFSNECQHFRNYLLSIEQIPRTVLEMSMLLKEKNISDLFPYTDIVSRIFLCLPALNCSAERSFSTLKELKIICDRD